MSGQRKRYKQKWGRVMTYDAPRHRVSVTRIAIAVAGLLLLTAGWWAWGQFPQWFGIDTVRRAVAAIRSLGAWGMLLSIALMTVHSFLPFPAEVIAIANGVIYGPVWGSVITWVGAMIGATSAFGIVRGLGRPFVRWMLPARQQAQLASWSRQHAGLTILLARLLPAIAFNLVNYASALTDVSLWTFLWATGIGILPLTICLNLLGDRMLTGWNGLAFVVATLALALTCVAVYRLVRRRAAAGIRDHGNHRSRNQ
ncbi:TVP38/TMEM64 family protein (plasmid) [Burkholderia glumae]|uniref:TVP38/TMEM64 family membrane protein n=2 Tax=Burkholderia glumae TaxID=337 RepID=A0AAP9Y4W4_BURGL|nr:DedA family protein [Burkholderia glumae BGR1]AJY62266.1 hypothetical protein KS03_5840 [Burkholderia glumae LMG 2196 = ATCC 33617]KHJ64937.1 membrane protein [Burkholderia glumae]NVE26260.1 TVP38/TMEM64 family protein [Burkholderia glumae]PNK93225.1 TVP38/TMEM64 family protein [Burkholderia glumae]